ncbi:MAG TPA: hypothetical protein VE010_20235, partial [Thermoanaerobaculia bacterium]|nr:hypothetical protein [Thermoanaerobaculia bacterium]
AGTIEVAGFDLTAAADGISANIDAPNSGTTYVHDLSVLSATLRGIVVRGTGAHTVTASNNSVAATGIAFDARGALVLAVNDNNFTSATNDAVVIDSITGSGAAASPTVTSVRDDIATPEGAITVTATAAPVITSFAGNHVSGNTAGSGVVIANSVFDAIPGSPLNVVNGGASVIGNAGNPVGAFGLFISNTSGHLSFTSLSVEGASGISVTGSAAISGGTQLSAASGSVNAVGGPAIAASSATLNLALNTLSSANSTTSAISLNTVTGSLTATGGALTNATAADVNITASNLAFTYGGAITDDLGQLVSVSAATGGTYTFAGAITDGNDGDGNGISLGANAAATTINFTGSVTLSTGAVAAFTATNAGSLNVTGNGSRITTTTATAINLTGTTIGTSGVRFESVTSNGGTSAAIVLKDTGAGAFTISGSGTVGSGGTISNKAGDAVTLSNTGGMVALKYVIIQDIGATTGAFHTLSGHDAIHGQNVNGGLTLEGATIRRISDNAVNGATATNTATVWNGLTIVNSTIEDTNRFHVSGVGDANLEGAVRIIGVRGAVNITGSTLQRGAELLDLFATDGAVNMTITGSRFLQAYKEFTSGAISSVGNHCVDLTLQGLATATVTIGDRTNTALANEFLNCRVGSVRVANDPGATGAVTAVVGRNNFAVNDHSSGFGGDFDFPQGGVAFVSRGANAAAWNVVVDNNIFDEVTNASGGTGQLTLDMKGGTWQVLAEDNTFDTPGNAPWFIRADATPSSKVLLRNNTGIRGFFTCPDASCGGGFFGPSLRAVADVQNGASLDFTVIGDRFAQHDTSFDPGQTLEARVLANGGGGSLCLNLQNNSAADGYSIERYAGTFNLYTPGGSGTCPPNTLCQNALDANGNTGGNGSASTDPAVVNVQGTISLVPAACGVPSGSIF